MNKLVVSMTLLILTVNVVCQPLIRSQQRRASTEPVGAVKESKSSPASVQEILWWLPEDTETISVVRGPFKVVAPAEPSEDMSATDFVELALHQAPLGYLGIIKDGAFLKHFIGRTVSLCVDGSRRFRAPTSLGGMRFEGCSIIMLEQDLPERTALLNQMASRAKVFHNIEGHRIAEFEEKLEEDTWRFLVAMPAPNVLLCATNQDFLAQVLNRMTHRGARRGLPETLPEWKHINTEARFWAVRHYDAGEAKNDPSSPLSGEEAAANWPDTQAIGIVFDFDPARSKVATVRYLSRNEKGLKSFSDEMKKASYPGQDFKPQFHQTEPGIVEMAMSLVENEQAGMFIFVLLMLFGHGVYV
jgi:hypothetical protein